MYLPESPLSKSSLFGACGQVLMSVPCKNVKFFCQFTMILQPLQVLSTHIWSTRIKPCLFWWDLFWSEHFGVVSLETRGLTNPPLQFRMLISLLRIVTFLCCLKSTGWNASLLTLMLILANLATAKWCKKTLKNDWNPATWVLTWEYSVRGIQ